MEPDGASPGATYPAGFLAGGVVAGLKESGRPDMGVLAVAPEWRAKAASACCLHHERVRRGARGAQSDECDLGHLVAVVMNSGNANACTGEPGLAVARAMQKACADALGVPAAQVAVGSTGIIGVQLDSGVVTAGRSEGRAGGQSRTADRSSTAAS